MTDEEMAKWRQSNVGVFPDVVGDDMALQFGLKLKTMCGHINGQNCNTFAFLPNFS